MPDHTITIRWPDSALCANRRMAVRSRGALAAATALKRNYGDAAYVLWLATKPPAKPYTKATLTVSYVPPDHRHRDRDNLGTAIKPVLDAAVKAGIIADDCMDVLFAEHHYALTPDPRNPQVRITIQPLQP